MTTQRFALPGQDVGRRLWLRRALSTFVLLGVAVSALALAIAVPTPVRAASASPLTSTLSDDFTHDSTLNSALWQVNGPVASNFSNDNCPGCTLIPLTPSFSSAGMEIASANGSSEVGAIQSIANFSAPLTLTALVQGIVSDGHPFVFGITTQDASAGVQVTANLNPNDCSAENNCGNPSTCGTPANASIPPNQCYYGVYARTASSGGDWKKTPTLYPTPSVEVVYTLTIAVDGSGLAQYNISAGGQVLGQATTQVGNGPFYIIMAQSEGAPVPGPGPNSAVWSSLTLTPSANFSPPSSSPSGLSSIEWFLIIILVVVALLVLLVVWSRRGRELTVTVLDAGTLSPIPGAGVSADGPKSFSGSTGADGRVAFGGVKAGAYSVKAGAAGYASPPPSTVSVRRATAHTVRMASSAPPSLVVGPAPAVPPPQPIAPSPGLRPEPTPVVPPVAVPAASTAPPMAPPPVAAAPEEEEGFGGERIGRIIQTFRAKGALSPETALTAEQLGLSRIFVRIMKRRRGRTRVFVEVNGRYYLDEKALQEMR